MFLFFRWMNPHTEDIYTLDGTLRYSKGDVAAKITTDETGTAVTDPLYLGKFEIREIKAPCGMTISSEVYTAELTYAGQEVEITETTAEFYNERQKAEISLVKVLEKNELFGIGMNEEILRRSASPGIGKTAYWLYP